MFEQLPDSVSIYEVAPRDGLQNEATPISLEGKKRIVTALLQSGVKRLELTSFVSPRWIPQLADAEELAQAFPREKGIILSALCPNAKGFERAKAAGLREIAIFLSASETHNRKNTNKTIAQSLRAFKEVVGLALEAKMRVRGYISTVWGCPYEGDVDPARALALTEKLLALGCYQVSLGDTIGVGTPRQTEDICQRFKTNFPLERLALHFHDTRGTALANALIGLQLGYSHFDASVAGIGGCPYAPGAAGNLATEDPRLYAAPHGNRYGDRSSSLD